MGDVDLFIEMYCKLTEQDLNYTVNVREELAHEEFMVKGNCLSARDIHGIRNGINILNQIEQDISLAEDMVHRPSFRIRGVIEGFYGKPWSHAQRIRGLVHFAKTNMNSFVFAPKDDPWQRFDWRTPFSSSFLASTKEIVELGHELLIDVSVCVSPGLTISYRSADDLSALLVRYEQLYEIGVRRFGLLLDDIPDKLQFEVDRKQFHSLAEAHARLANDVNYQVATYGPGTSLFVCPLQYHGRGNEPYISELGRKLDANINLMWTGRQICSEYLEVFDAKNFLVGTSKRPFYWDNYPVNDVAMVHQLHIGPIQKRDKDLGKYSEGLVANPMDRFEASLIPLTTIADYLWNSSTYDPEKSWQSALNHFVQNEKDRNAVRHLFRNCFESCLAVDAAPEFGDMLGEVTLAWRTGNLFKAIEVLETWSNDIAMNYLIITSPSFSWPKLLEEIIPWLEKYRKVGLALSDVAQVLKSSRYSEGRLSGTLEAAERIRQIRISLAQDPTRIFGDGLDLVLGELATELSVAH